MKKNKLLNLAVAMVMLVTLILPAGTPVYAASNPGSYIFDISEGNITVAAGSGGNIHVTYGSGQTTTADFSNTQEITIIGTTTTNKVVVDSVTAIVYLDNASIQPAAGCAFALANGANVTLFLVGSNTLKSVGVNAGLQVSTGQSVTIQGTGSLSATGGTNSTHAAGGYGHSGAGIGGGDTQSGGNITILSGTITANGGNDGLGTNAAGIGGGSSGSGGHITITGGMINATPGIDGACIGGGSYGSGGTIYISGGSITANSNGRGAAIGGGLAGTGGVITISGGTINAMSPSGAGIGGGSWAANGTITISGGTVTAISNAATGIGGGYNSNGGSISITGGTVVAIGGIDGAGIGGGGGAGTGGAITMDSAATIKAAARTAGKAIDPSATISGSADVLAANFNSLHGANVTTQVMDKSTVPHPVYASFTPTQAYQSIAFSVASGAYQLKTGGILQHDAGLSTDFDISSNGITSFTGVADDISPLASFTPVTLTQTGDVAHGNVQYTTAAAVIAVLPTTIAVTLVNGSVVNVPVTWADTDHYNAGIAAYYTFTATWGTMPAGANNGNNLLPPTVGVTVAQGIPETYTATINLNKDGSTWTGSGKAITLQQASEAPTATTESSGVFTANVVNGTWKISVNGANTGATVVINNGAASQEINYYTVNFAVADAGAASGSTVAATYNSSAISSGDVVLGGKELVITATGAGAYSYTYAWSGAGTSGETTAAMTIPSLGSSVNATCNVGGIGMPPTITTASLQDGTIGTAYDQTLAATGTAPITWSITTGALPAGLSLNSNIGVIMGTPNAAGTSTFTVQASNSNGNDTKTYIVTITAAPATYTLTITAGSGGTVSSAGGTYAAGSPVSITATPGGNYSFSGWTSSNGGTFDNASSASTTFTMPANNTTITAGFTYNGGGGGSGGGTPASVPTPTPAHIPIIVDGTDYYIGNFAVEDNTATITVDQSEFDKQLANARDSVVIPVTSDAGTVVAQLVVKNVQDMNDKGVPLYVQTGNISYNIPAASIDTKTILSALGAPDPLLAPVNVIIKTNVDSVSQVLVNSAIKVTGVEEVVPALQFEITANYNGKTYNVENFDHFVSRSVEITFEQAQQITTAIVVNSDGTTRHVPTDVYQKDGKWYAQINSLTNSTYVLIFNQIKFSDAEGKWYQSVVNEMGGREIINGVGNNCFAGGKAITRAEFAAVLVRALGLPTNGTATFSDVPSDSWYSGAVATAAEYGIVSGIGNNKFAPDAKITREEAMQMIYKASKLTPYVAVTGVDNTKNFTDYGKQSSWATDAVNFNINNGFIQGFNGQLNQKSNITRAETATVVLRLLQKSGLVDARTKL